MDFRITDSDIQAAMGLLKDAGYSGDKREIMDAAIELIKASALRDISTQLHKLEGVSHHLHKIENLGQAYYNNLISKD